MGFISELFNSFFKKEISNPYLGYDCFKLKTLYETHKDTITNTKMQRDFDGPDMFTETVLPELEMELIVIEEAMKIKGCK